MYHWLEEPTAAWGCTPIVDNAGEQCLTVKAVDHAVRSYWVDQVLCQHRAVNGAERWRLFEASEFYPCVPVLEWPHAPWTEDLVSAALRAMGERSSPGLPNVPIAVWKALPPTWNAAIARLLNLIESEGQWPAEWLDAYIVMIPKAAGGSRPRDQRPITVLPVVYRLWAKGITLQWQSVMHHAYLGQAAMGFRAQSGTLHVAQLLSDLIVLCRSRRSELWLVSFDIEKCYDSVPWWALFGMMRRTGIAEAVVGCFEAYYRDLRRRFRYGQVDGACWQASNSLMQGCPASPDELNLLLEPFHRWALAAGLGVDTGAGRVPSVSFADDVALIAGDRREAETLIAAYLRWCDLLQLKVTKAQLWSNTGPDQELVVGSLRMTTVSTFKIVGVVLGLDEAQATELHLAPRLAKASRTLQRLRALELPASIGALLWRTAVLPQALYGCEVRNVRPKQLMSLSSGGKAALGSKYPLQVNTWRAPEVLGGPPWETQRCRTPCWPCGRGSSAGGKSSPTCPVWWARYTEQWPGGGRIGRSPPQHWQQPFVPLVGNLGATRCACVLRRGRRWCLSSPTWAQSNFNRSMHSPSPLRCTPMAPYHSRVGRRRSSSMTTSFGRPRSPHRTAARSVSWWRSCWPWSCNPPTS